MDKNLTFQRVHNKMIFIDAATVTSILKVVISPIFEWVCKPNHETPSKSRRLIQSDICFLPMQPLSNYCTSYHFLPEELVFLCAETSDDETVDVFSPAVDCITYSRIM